jgi:hypothetical protein
LFSWVLNELVVCIRRYPAHTTNLWIIVFCFWVSLNVWIAQSVHKYLGSDTVVSRTVLEAEGS